MIGILGFFIGFFIILLLHLLQVGLYYYLSEIGSSRFVPHYTIVFLVFGFLQAIYAIPVMMYAYAYWDIAFFWGMLTCAILTLLLQLRVWLIFAGYI